MRRVSLRALFFKEFFRRVRALQFIVFMSFEHARRSVAFEAAHSLLRTDAAALLAAAVAAARAQQRAQLTYIAAFDEWCRQYVFAFVRRQALRIEGALAAQRRRAEFREEDRIAREKRVSGDACVILPNVHGEQ
jgi:hypothetical protein